MQCMLAKNCILALLKHNIIITETKNNNKANSLQYPPYFKGKKNLYSCSDILKNLDAYRDVYVKYLK